MAPQSRILVPESFNFPRAPEKTKDYSVRVFATQLLEILTDMVTEYSSVINIKMVSRQGDIIEGKLEFDSAGYIVLPLRAGDPLLAETGRIWYDTTSNLFRGKKVAGYRTLLTNDEGLIKTGDTFVGKLQFSAATGELILPIYAGDPAVPSDGEIWYNSVLPAFRRRRNGVTESW